MDTCSPMPRSAKPEASPTNAAQREGAEYIADMLLGLRKTAKRNQLPFLVHLLEMAFYEAYTIARETEPDMRMIETLNQLSDIS